MNHHMRRWGAAYILLILFIGSWLGQWLTHSGPTEDFWNATFENWQSEWLQLLVQAIALLALKHYIFKAEAEDMEQVQEDLRQIKEKLEIDG